jgi:hypothetical protein
VFANIYIALCGLEIDEMSHFNEDNEYDQTPYQPYMEYVDTTHTQPPDSEYEYDDDAETEAFLAQQRSARFSVPMPGKLDARAQSRMPKAEALNVVYKLKGLIIAGSLVVFGLLSVLVASHSVSASSQATPTTTPGTNAGTNSGSPSTGGNYFQQQQGGGYGFGNPANNGSGFGNSSSVSGSQAS